MNKPKIHRNYIEIPKGSKGITGTGKSITEPIINYLKNIGINSWASLIPHNADGYHMVYIESFERDIPFAIRKDLVSLLIPKKRTVKKV